MYKSLLLCVIVTTLTNVDTTETSNDGPLVVTPMGAIRGSWMETRRGRRIQAYRGIRYAQPPVRELRFQPPQPILKYHEEVNATEDGPVCPQPVGPSVPVDEDCLRINVYTPDNRNSNNLPVIFFIHPGGFYSSSGRSLATGPQYLLEFDVVLVTINYRLGTLGLLSTGDKLAPGNNALKDQVMALRWVQKNIAAFGGNPNLVTIAGNSAGSRSVMLHMISPMSKGLFHRAISFSGAPTNQVRIPKEQKSLAVRQAQILNCPTNSSKEIIDCLKTKNYLEIGRSLSGMYEFAYDPVLIWSPVVEPDCGQERFLDIDPEDAIRQGKIHAVPYIISQTKDEFFWKAFTILGNDTFMNRMNTEWDRIAPISFQLPRENPKAATAANILKRSKNYLAGHNLNNDEASAIGLGRLYADGITGYPMHRLAKLMSRYSSQPVYFYMLSYVGNRSHYEDPITKKPLGVAHHDDLIYLFSRRFFFPDIELNTEDSKMVDKMTAIWYTFAKYGDPNPHEDLPAISSLSWPAMTAEGQEYLQIDKEFSVHRHLYKERYDVWDELYPIE